METLAETMDSVELELHSDLRAAIRRSHDARLFVVWNRAPTFLVASRENTCRKIVNGRAFLPDEMRIDLPGHIGILMAEQRRDFRHGHAVRQEQTREAMTESMRRESFDLSLGNCSVQGVACSVSMIRQAVLSGEY